MKLTESKLFYAILVLTTIADVSLSQESGASSRIHASRLQEMLFANYTTALRPVEDFREKVIVEADLVLKQLVDVDVKTQQMTLLIWHRIVWADYFLQWNITEFGGIRTLRIDPTKIWVPDVVYLNSLRDFETIKEVTMIPTRVTHFGRVIWLLPLIKTTTCRMNVRYFPYDRQNCRLELGPWSSTIEELDVKFLKSEHKHSTNYYMEHHEWDWMTSYRYKEEYSITFPGSNEQFTVPKLIYGFVFQRKPVFYEKNLLIPTSLISSLSMITFMLPIDCGEKIGFAVTVFLSLCVNLVVITEYIPASSETYPVIGDYYLVCIFLIAISMLSTTFILSLHFLPLGASPVPNNLRTIMFEYVGVVLGYKNNPFREKGPGSKYLKYKLNLAKMRLAARKKIMSLSGRRRKLTIAGVENAEDQNAEVQENEDNDSLNEAAKKRLTWTFFQEDEDLEIPEDDEQYSPAESPTVDHDEQTMRVFFYVKKVLDSVSRIERNISAVIDKKHDGETKKCIMEEWKYVARIIDRFCAILYGLASVTCFLVFNVLAQYGHSDDDDY